MYYNVPWDDLKNGKPVPPIETSWGDDTEMKIEQRGNYIKKELFEIYENPVITNRSYGRGFLDGVREGLRVISEAQTVDAIEIPKNITNGDMIKTMFPNIEIEGIGGEIKCIAAKNGTSYFALDWWNAPYKNSSN